MKATIQVQSETYDVHFEYIEQDDEVGEPGGFEFGDIYLHGDETEWDIYDELPRSVIDEIEDNIINGNFE